MIQLAVAFTSVTLFLLAMVVFVALVAFLNMQSQWHDRYEKRVAALHRGPDAVIEEAQKSTGEWLLGIVRELGEMVTRSGLLSRRSLDEFRHTLQVAGFRSHNAIGVFVGGKLLLFVVMPLLAWLLLRQFGHSSNMQLYVPLGLAVAGLLGPDFIVRRMHKKHLAALEAGLPDALDMLVICTQAGLGLEPAIERVGQEIRLAHQAVAEELMITSHEMRVNADRRTALLNLGKRTGLESLKRLGGTLVQSIQYGTPLSDALRTLSAEQRQEALNRFEERAGRLSVLLTMPMIAFILPCLIMVVGGPAIVQAINAFSR